MLLGTNQSETKSNASRQSWTALSHVCYVLYWSETYLMENGSSEIILLYISWVLYWSGI